MKINLGLVDECSAISVSSPGIPSDHGCCSLCFSLVFCTSICTFSNVTLPPTGATQTNDIPPFDSPSYQMSPMIVQVFLTFVLSLSALLLTAFLSWTITCIFSVSLVFITFLAPAVLVWAQKHKKYVPRSSDI